MAEKLRPYSDFNDLQCAAGVNAVRDQIEAAVQRLYGLPAANESPVPSCVPVGFEPEFAPDGSDYDQEFYGEPLNSPAPSGAGVGLYDQSGRYTIDGLMEHFYYIYGTKHCWDGIRREQMELSHLGHLVGRERYKAWMESGMRKMVQGLKFEPGQDVGRDWVNLFEGWDVEPAGSDGGCQRILRHVFHLCGDRQVEYDWLLNWLAYPLQHPGTKMASAVLVHGSEGTGKSILFADVMQRIYGKHHITIGQAQLDSSFTEWQSGKLFATAEEVIARTERSHYKGVLKHLVTGHTLMIDQKHMSLRQETNHLNFVFLSNSTQPLELDIGDRRYMVLYIDRVPDGQYFTELFEEINGGGVEAFFRHLLSRDLSQFSPHSKPPLNSEKQRLVDASMLSPAFFYQQWISGELELPPMHCKCSDLFLFFKYWCEGTNEFRRTQRYFTQEIKRCAGIEQVRVNISYPTAEAVMNTHRVFTVDTDVGTPCDVEDGPKFVGRQCRSFRDGLAQVGVIRNDA